MSAAPSAPLSGTPIPLRHGGYAAAIASIGAGIRSLAHDGRDLVLPYGEEEVRPLYRGAVLVPWPNRVVDGRYRFGGEPHQLPLTEPDRGHALHGLNVWTDYAVVDRAPDAVALEADVVPQTGYPFRLAVRVEHRLTASGLTTTVTARNTGTRAAPYGTSYHPYLVGGAGRVDDWTLALAADRVLEVEGDRLAPIGLAATRGTEFDFAEPQRIGSRFVDHALTGLRRDEAGLATATLIADDGSGVRMTWDAASPWVQVHTADRPEPQYHRRGLAVEPMTCPPDAFNSGTDLVVLEPGQSHAASWTVAAL